MKKLLSINYSDTAFNTGTFVLRVVFGLLMCLDHGFGKLTNFNELQQTFSDPFHIGHRWSLVLCIFAEVFASMLLVLGLFSRIAALILVIDMVTALFFVHSGQPLKQMEPALIFLSGFLFILLAGPGKFSVDGMAGK
jgi:putative oxidoreductase